MIRPELPRGDADEVVPMTSPVPLPPAQAEPRPIQVWRPQADPATPTTQGYDALLIVGFGGPEHRDHVIPYLENVLRGKPVPRERMLEVAEHYYHYDGVSPINAQTAELIDALRNELDGLGLHLPIYWGNRNWYPMLDDVVQQMTEDGVTKALAVVMAAYSSYSSCRQYRENVMAAQEKVGDHAPHIDKMRVFYNHPDFVAANADRIREALERLPEGQREQAHIAFTAHSIPAGMAKNCNYVVQLTESCRLVTEALGIPPERWQLVYQSRSGRPSDPWLEPDILDHLKDLRHRQATAVVIHPIGFLSDHMEVMFDLDEEAQETADELQMTMVRSASVGTHPTFVRMLGDLIRERTEGLPERQAVGKYRASHDVCPTNCCMSGRPGAPEGQPAPMVLAD